MKMDDRRDFLDEFDEVQRIKVPLDLNLEMGAITRRCYVDVGAPAALFENIKCYSRRDSERWARRWVRARSEEFVICWNRTGPEPATKRSSEYMGCEAVKLSPKLS